MSTDIEQLRLAVGNVLREELPSVVPGLTKLAYEQIIDETLQTITEDVDLEKVASPTEADITSWFAKNMRARSPLISSQAAKNMATAFQKNVGHVAGGMGVLAAAGATLVGLNKAVNAVKTATLHPAFLQALETAIKSPDKAGEILRGADRQKVMSYGETIFKYAPNVATDPNLLKGILANVIDYGSIDPATIRSLMELEEKRKNLQMWKPSDILAKG